MEFVIGEKIREKIEEKGVTQKAFANAIGMTTRNLERFFERSDISIKQLVKASEFLNFDFVTLYLSNSPAGKKLPFFAKEQAETYIPSINQNEISIQVNIKGELDLISKNLPELLKKIKKEAEDRGLHLA